MTTSLDLKKDLSKVEDEIPTTGLDDLDALAEAASASAKLRRRFVLAIDATSSMYAEWEMAKTALVQAVEEIKRRTLVPFQIQVVAYRDRTFDSNYLQQSEWSNDENYLKEFISEMTCTGGGDFPESVDVGIGCTIPDNPNQIILVGDAPGRYESPGYKEASQLGQQNCPIYALWVRNEPSTIQAFKKLASLSGGKAFALTTNKEAFADILALIFAQDKSLMITYQATTIEGKKLELEFK